MVLQTIFDFSFSVCLEFLLSFKSSVTSSEVTNNLHLIEFTLYSPPVFLILVATKVKYLADEECFCPGDWLEYELVIYTIHTT